MGKGVNMVVNEHRNGNLCLKVSCHMSYMTKP